MGVEAVVVLLISCCALVVVPVWSSISYAVTDANMPRKQAALVILAAQSLNAG
jgi:hypothetical protein